MPSFTLKYVSSHINIVWRLKTPECLGFDSHAEKVVFQITRWLTQQSRLYLPVHKISAVLPLYSRNKYITCHFWHPGRVCVRRLSSPWGLQRGFNIHAVMIVRNLTHKCFLCHFLPNASALYSSQKLDTWALAYWKGFLQLIVEIVKSKPVKHALLICYFPAEKQHLLRNITKHLKATAWLKGQWFVNIRETWSKAEVA